MTWYQRNKKWFLPTVIIVPILILVLFVFTILTVVNYSLKTSEPYKLTLKTVWENTECVENLGKPIKTTYFITGQVHVSFSSGNASFRIPLKGSKNHGVVYSVCEKNKGEWEITNLDIKIKDELIDIK